MRVPDNLSDGFHPRKHATTEAEDEMQGGLLLDVVVREGSAILKLKYHQAL